MPDIVDLGYNVDTAQVARGENALDDLTRSTEGADRAGQDFDRTQRTLSGTLSGFVGNHSAPPA